MSLSRWDEGSDSDHVTGVKRDTWLVGHRKIPAWQRAKLPRYGREGAVEVRPFPAKTRLHASKAQGLSGEAVKWNPTTTVIRGVDESKSSPSNNRRLDRTHRRQNSSFLLVCNRERNLSRVVCQIRSDYYEFPSLARENGLDSLNW
jgi:hypothetical protein